MTKHLPRAHAVGFALVGACACGLSAPVVQASPGPPVRAAATAPPTVLDPGRVIALAGDGRTTAWLHADYGPNGGQPTSVTLWTRDAAGAVTRIDRRLPSRPAELAVGDDGRGTTTIVLVAGGTTKSGPTTLYALPANGSAAPRRLRASRPGGAESAPGLQDGALSFTRQERTRPRGVVHATVRLGSLSSQKSRLVSDGRRGTDITDTVPTADRGVAYVTERANGVGATSELRVLRAGHASKRLSRTSFGGASVAGFGALAVTAEGRRLVVTRWNDGGGHAADRTTYRVPSGSAVGSPERLQPGESDLGVPVDGGYVYVDHDLPTPGDEDGQLVFRTAG